MKNGSVADDAARVLICDDNAAMRALLTAVVDGAANMKAVGEAADGNEALTAAVLHRPDVILLDLAMPGRSGLEVLPDLQRVAPDAKIVVFSGFARSVLGEDVLALGAACYLEKGADPDAIVGTIERVLATESVMSATTPPMA